MVADNIGNLRFALQTGKGAPAASSAYGLLLHSGTMPHIEVTEGDFEETTAKRMRSARYRGGSHVAGEPAFYVTPKALGVLLYGVLGGKNAPVGTADPWSHTIFPASELPWFTFWRRNADLIWERYEDCKISRLVLHGEHERPLTVAINIIGRLARNKTQAAADTEASTPIEMAERFMHANGNGALLVEGVANTSIGNFDLTIENNATPQPGDDSIPDDVSAGLLAVMLRANQAYVTDALRKRLYFGSATPADNARVVNEVLELTGSPQIDLKWTRVAAAPGPERSLRVQIARVTVDPFDAQPGTGGAPMRVDHTYRALQPDTGHAVTATMVNGQATI